MNIMKVTSVGIDYEILPLFRMDEITHVRLSTGMILGAEFFEGDLGELDYVVFAYPDGQDDSVKCAYMNYLQIVPLKEMNYLKEMN